MLITNKLIELLEKNQIEYKLIPNKALEDYSFFELLKITGDIDTSYKYIAEILGVEYIFNNYWLERYYELVGLNQSDNEKAEDYAKRLRQYRNLEYFHVRDKKTNKYLMLCVNPFDVRLLAEQSDIDILLISSVMMANIFHVQNKDDYLLVYDDGEEMSQFIKKVMAMATSVNASDIKFLSFPADVKIKFNIDGQWGEWLGILSKMHKNKLFASLANMGKIPYSNGISVNFDIQTDIKNVKVIWRVNISHTIDGGAITLRSDNVDSKIKTFKELGFNDRAIEEFGKIKDLKSGMILVTGGTRKGKSWTLNAFIDDLANKYNKDVALLGNPIEKRIENVTMRQLKTTASDDKYNITFDSFLSDQLRQNNDVLGLVEARGNEEARKMFGFAITEHLVLSTIHTPNFISTLTRLTDIMEVPHTIVGDTLEIVISQDLIPAICPRCKIVKGDGFKINEEGCDLCNHGILGEQLIYEKVSLDKKSRIMISEKTMPHIIYEYLLKENRVISFIDTLKEAQIEGKISIDYKLGIE